MDAQSPTGPRATRQVPGRSGGFRSPRWWGLIALTYAMALAAGGLASLARMPLPWMLGPFFVLAALSIAGFKFALAPYGRELGQVAIGTAVGMRFTPPVLAAAASLLPAMAGATLYVIAFTMLAAFLFKPLARVDDVTAFFATAAGGVADMANVAHEHGGAPGSVAIVHALRVSGVVALVPFLVVFLGEPGSVNVMSSAASPDLLQVFAALAAGFLMARLLKPTPLPNPWLVGPIFMGIVLGVSGLLAVKVPRRSSSSPRSCSAPGSAASFAAISLWPCRA